MTELYRLLEENNVDLCYGALPHTILVSARAPSGRCYVGLDYSMLWEGARCREHLAHELGHCVTGSFYGEHTPPADRRRMEARAERWAIGHLVPPAALTRAMEQGYTEEWELAEYFSVPHAFMHRALEHYRTTGRL